MPREFRRHVDVHDVDTSGLSSGDSLLDGAIAEPDCVVDLVLDGCGRIPWDNLKQVWIASDHDERIRRRIGHQGVQVAETAPEQSSHGRAAGLLHLADPAGRGLSVVLESRHASREAGDVHDYRRVPGAERCLDPSVLYSRRKPAPRREGGMRSYRRWAPSSSRVTEP